VKSEDMALSIRVVLDQFAETAPSVVGEFLEQSLCFDIRKGSHLDGVLNALVYCIGNGRRLEMRWDDGCLVVDRWCSRKKVELKSADVNADHFAGKNWAAKNLFFWLDSWTLQSKTHHSRIDSYDKLKRPLNISGFSGSQTAWLMVVLLNAGARRRP
jgi:hypothetical protein